MKISKYIIFLLFCLASKTASAQINMELGEHLVPAVVRNGDTIPYLWLDRQYVKAKAPDWLIALRKRNGTYDRDFAVLRYNVRKVYPYAVLAANVLYQIDSAMAAMYSKDAKNLFRDRMEQALNNRFKAELTDMTTTQGKILVKLINRQSGKDVYSVVKNLKGGLNARLWQGMALLFDNNLHNTYDPAGEDIYIEALVRELEMAGPVQVPAL